MANIRKTKREVRMDIPMAKEEKKLFTEYAKELGINPTRLARNIIMQQAEAKLRNNAFYIPVTKAYIKYLEITNQKEILERIKTP